MQYMLKHSFAAPIRYIHDMCSMNLRFETIEDVRLKIKIHTRNIMHGRDLCMWPWLTSYIVVMILIIKAGYMLKYCALLLHNISLYRLVLSHVEGIVRHGGICQHNF